MPNNRIIWSKDGTVAWKWNATEGSVTAISAANMTIMDGVSTSSNTVNLYSGAVTTKTGMILNFPGVIRVSKIGMKINLIGGSSTLIIKTSADSTTGVDGTWTTAYSGSWPTVGEYGELIMTTVSDALWIRFNWEPNFTNEPLCYAFHVFGEYQAPRFEFWNVGETAELPNDYPFDLPVAGNRTDYSDRFQFKLKNLDSSVHTYSVSIEALDYNGDAIVTDHITLSVNGGTNKASSVNVSSVSAGGFSSAIDVWGDMTTAHNPANGYHFFRIKVTETA